MTVQAGMGSMPIVVMQPIGEVGGSFAGMAEGASIEALAKRRLNEAFGLPIGSGRIRLGEWMADMQALAGFFEALGAEDVGVVGVNRRTRMPR